MFISNEDRWVYLWCMKRGLAAGWSQFGRLCQEKGLLMKRTPFFVRKTKAKGGVPKELGQTELTIQTCGTECTPNSPGSDTSASPSGWAPGPLQPTQEINFGAFLAKLIPVVDSLWKADARWSKADPSEQGGGLKHLGRNLKAGLDSLHSAGFEVKDHTNERYVEGTRIEVLAFQPVDGIAFSMVIETLKPTIYFMDRLVRPGQVIVGKPINANLEHNA